MKYIYDVKVKEIEGKDIERESIGICGKEYSEILADKQENNKIKFLTIRTYDNKIQDIAWNRFTEDAIGTLVKTIAIQADSITTNDDQVFSLGEILDNKNREIKVLKGSFWKRLKFLFNPKNILTND